jgi:hypothetical protein
MNISRTRSKTGYLVVEIRSEVDTSAVEFTGDGNAIAREEGCIAEEPGRLDVSVYFLHSAQCHLHRAEGAFLDILSNQIEKSKLDSLDKAWLHTTLVVLPDMYALASMTLSTCTGGKVRGTVAA